MHATASDAALARKAGLGDADAFAKLCARHFQATFRYALHMLDGDERLAEDASGCLDQGLAKLARLSR